MVLAPHPDDEACIAATLAAHVARGDQLAVIIVTDGRASRQLGLNEDQVAARRREEAERARDLLRPDRWEWLGLPDLDFEEGVLMEKLRVLLDELRPDIIYAPSCVDGHPDHLRCASALARTVPLDVQRIRIRCFQVQIPLTPVLVNLAIDGSAYAELAQKALETYGSQHESLARLIRTKRYAAKLYGGARWVDEFWELEASAYRDIHRARLEDRFEGFRPNAFRDPLAYLRGTRARLRLSKKS